MIKTVSIDQIRADPNQPRKVFSEDHLEGLAQNLKTEGMINPIEVDEDNMIITGECRWRAAKKAGWKKIPINVNARKFSEYTRLRHQMSENLHQSAAGGSSPMNAIDVAKGYKRMLELSGYKWLVTNQLKRSDAGIRKLSRELGVHHKTIIDYLSLLQEPKYVLEDIAKGRKHTPYIEAKRVPKKYRKEIKKAITEGKIQSARAIRRFGVLAKEKPDKAMVELLRITQKQSEDANRILNRAIELSLALKKADPNRFTLEDKKMVRGQLGSTTGSIRTFVGKMKTSETIEEGEIIN